MRLCQAALCTAKDENQHLRDDNARLKANLRLKAPAAAGASGSTTSKQLAWIKHDSLLEHAPLIIFITKKITMFEWAWIHKTPGGIGLCPIPDPDEAVAAKYKDPAALARSIAYVLYSEFPDTLHTALAEMPALRDAVRILLFYYFRSTYLLNYVWKFSDSTPEYGGANCDGPGREG